MVYDTSLRHYRDYVTPARLHLTVLAYRSGFAVPPKLAVPGRGGRRSVTKDTTRAKVARDSPDRIGLGNNDSFLEAPEDVPFPHALKMRHCFPHQ